MDGNRLPSLRVWSLRRVRATSRRRSVAIGSVGLLMIATVALMYRPTPQVEPTSTGDDRIEAPAVPTQAPEMPAVDPIDLKYRELGGETGKLGPPSGDTWLLPGSIGRFRSYRNGIIVWTPALGARAMDLATALEQGPGELLPAMPVGPAAPGGLQIPTQDQVFGRPSR